MADASEIIVKLIADATGLEAGLVSAADSVKAAQASIASSSTEATTALQAQIDALTQFHPGATWRDGILEAENYKTALAHIQGTYRGLFDEAAAQADARAAAAQSAADGVAEADASIASAGDATADAVDAQAAQMDAAFASIAEGVNAAADAAKASLAEMTASMLAARSLLQNITDSTGFNYAGYSGLESQQRALNAAYDAGVISGDDYADAQRRLEAQMSAVDVQTDASIAAQKDLQAAREAAVTAGLESSTMSEEDALAAIRDAAAQKEDGDATRRNADAHSRMPMGLYGAGMRVMEFAATPVGAATVGIAALAAVAVRGAVDQDRFNDALIATGQDSGAAAGQLRTLAAGIASTGPSLFESEDALLSVARSGQQVGVSMQTAATAVADVMALTGEKAQEATRQFESLGTGGVRSIAKINDEFNFLTPTEVAQIEHLETIGKTTEAATVAAQDFATTMQSRMAQAAESLTPLGKAWKGIVGDIEDSIGAVETFGNKAASAIDKVLSRLSSAAEGTGGPAPFESTAAYTKQVDSWMQADVVNGYVTMDSHGVPHITSGGMRSRPGDAGTGSLATPGVAALEQVVGEYDKLHNVLGADNTAVTGHAKAAKAAAESLDHFAHAHTHHARASTASNAPGTEELDARLGAFTQHNMAHLFTGLANPSEGISAGNSQAQAQASLQQSMDQRRVTLGEASNAQVLADAQASAEAVYTTRMQYLNQELSAYSNEPAKLASINDQIAAAKSSLAEKLAQIDAKSAQESVQTWQSILSPINNAVSTSVQGIVMGTETASQARLRIEESVVAETISLGERTLMNHIAMELAKTTATAAGVQERTALNMAGELEILAKHAEAAIKWIVTEAAKSAASAFSALAGIPIIGPALAVGASIAAGAAVLALASRVVSAEGGFERVPMDNMPAVLHKDEQVLPAEYAEGLRGLVSRGGGGGDTFHIHAIDAQSLHDYIQRNGRELGDALRMLGRRGFAA